MNKFTCGSGKAIYFSILDDALALNRMQGTASKASASGWSGIRAWVSSLCHHWHGNLSVLLLPFSNV